MSEVFLSAQAQERADLYGLAAALLLQPDGELVDALAATPLDDESDAPFAQAWSELLQAAVAGPEAVREQFDALFIAAGTPRLNPYQSWYRAGWLMDKPLANLREDLQRLGLSRARGATELEDHLGVLFEVMRVLIETQRPPQVQREFFQRHIAGWSRDCLHDIVALPGAPFYNALARFTQAFLDAEAQTLGLDEAAPELQPNEPLRRSQRAPDPGRRKVPGRTRNVAAGPQPRSAVTMIAAWRRSLSTASPTATR